MFKIIDVEQGSDAWLKERLGIFTASDFGKVVTPAQLKRSSSLDGLINKKVAEKLTGEIGETYKSKAMEIGNEREADALDMLNFSHGFNLETIGFVKSTELAIGASPDAINLEGKFGAEIKSPESQTHVSYLLKGVVPNIYIPQIQGTMAILGFDKWQFMSYYPTIKPLIIEVPRNEKYITALMEGLDYACEELETRYQRLK